MGEYFQRDDADKHWTPLKMLREGSHKWEPVTDAAQAKELAGARWIGWRIIPGQKVKPVFRYTDNGWEDCEVRDVMIDEYKKREAQDG